MNLTETIHCLGFIAPRHAERQSNSRYTCSGWVGSRMWCWALADGFRQTETSLSEVAENIPFIGDKLCEVDGSRLPL